MSWDEAQVLIKQSKAILDNIDTGSSDTPALPNNARISFVPEANITKDLGDIEEVFETAEERYLTIPISTIGHAIVLNGIMHVFYNQKHYTFDGNSFTELPDTSMNIGWPQCIVVLNNEIHVIGVYNSSSKLYDGHYKLEGSTWTIVSTIPYDFKQSSAVVLNNEIHIIGSRTSGNGTKHYKWNGSTWVSVSTLPYNFWGGCAAVLNNEIHIMCNSERYRNRHYKWNGSSWSLVSTIPITYADSNSIVIYNGEIHVVGSVSGTSDSNYVNHYKWNGSSWVSVSTLPYGSNSQYIIVYNGYIYLSASANKTYKFYKFDGKSWSFPKTIYSPYSKIFAVKSSVVVFNDKINILGGTSHELYSTSTEEGNRYYTRTIKQHYEWDGNKWNKVSELPNTFYGGSAVVLNSEIHVLGVYKQYYGMYDHYKWDGTSWSLVSTLPYEFQNGSAVVFNGEIHILGGSSGSTKHYKWNGSSWTEVSTLPYNVYRCAVVLNNEIHIIYSTRHYKWNGSEWTKLSNLPAGFTSGSAIVFNGEIHLLGGNASPYTQHYKWNGSEWTSVSILPHKTEKMDAVIYKGKIHLLGGTTKETCSKHYQIGAGITSIPAGQTLEGTIQVTRKTS